MPKRKDPNLGLTDEDFSRFDRACNATWQSIGSDCAELNGGKPFRRSEVIELVLDADRVRMYGEHNPGRRRLTCVSGVPCRQVKDCHCNDCTEFANRWEAVYDTRIRPWITEHYGTPAFQKVMARVFTYTRYE